jgi:hypothetical protein
MIVRPATAADLPQWAQLRIAPWGWDTVGDHAEEAERLYCAGHPGRIAFVALDDAGGVTGFAEAGRVVYFRRAL